MKGNLGSGKLPAAILLPGIAALALRKTLYLAAVDEKGLLLRGHPLQTVLTLLTAAVLAVILLVVRKQEKTEGYASAGLAAALGHVAAGAGILATVLSGGIPAMGGYLAGAWRCLGFAAPVCLALAGAARARRKQPFFLLYVVVCLYFVVHIVGCYQLWSSNPQMQDYVFALLGAMGLMFFGFYTAAQEAGCGNFRMKLGMGLAAIYLCAAELAGSSCPWLYLGGILWVLTELCSRETAEK